MGRPDGAAAAQRESRLTVKGTATRERIIDAAVELIGAQGVAGTSTDQVRRAAGVSGSQLYHYFDSKQALVHAVIARQADVAAEDSMLQNGALNSFEAMRSWVEVTLERHSGATGHDCDLPQLAGELAASDAETKGAVVAGYRRWKIALASGLGNMQQQQVIAADADVDELADVLLAALQGGSQLATILHDVRPMRAAMYAALAYVEAKSV
jgi:TetR/AcrR family transcriptional regulator, transcriptional repressor for nem operon